PISWAERRADQSGGVDARHARAGVRRLQDLHLHPERALEFHCGQEAWPRRLVADEEEVPVLRHVHGDAVLFREAQDHRDARLRQADVDLARELPAAARWNATEHPTIPAPITATSVVRGRSWLTGPASAR